MTFQLNSPAFSHLLVAEKLTAMKVGCAMVRWITDNILSADGRLFVSTTASLTYWKVRWVLHRELFCLPFYSFSTPLTSDSVLDLLISRSSHLNHPLSASSLGTMRMTIGILWKVGWFDINPLKLYISKTTELGGNLWQNRKPPTPIPI